MRNENKTKERFRSPEIDSLTSFDVHVEFCHILKMGIHGARFGVALPRELVSKWIARTNLQLNLIAKFLGIIISEIREEKIKTFEFQTNVIMERFLFKNYQIDSPNLWST